MVCFLRVAVGGSACFTGPTACSHLWYQVIGHSCSVFVRHQASFSQGELILGHCANLFWLTSTFEGVGVPLSCKCQILSYHCLLLDLDLAEALGHPSSVSPAFLITVLFQLQFINTLARVLSTALVIWSSV